MYKKCFRDHKLSSIFMFLKIKREEGACEASEILADLILRGATDASEEFSHQNYSVLELRI
jgi:hypothetical protein